MTLSALSHTREPCVIALPKIKLDGRLTLCHRGRPSLGSNVVESVCR